jgi:hypothetical protein
MDRPALPACDAITFPPCVFLKAGALFRRNDGQELRKRSAAGESHKAEGSAMNSFTAIVSILAAAAAVTFAITAYVN